jgi:hypothetical protein
MLARHAHACQRADVFSDRTAVHALFGVLIDALAPFSKKER